MELEKSGNWKERNIENIEGRRKKASVKERKMWKEIRKEICSKV